MIPLRDILPHRQPFSMLDTAEMVASGKARGTKLITVNDPAVMPDGTIPQTFLVEAMAQLSGIASGRTGGSMLASINDIMFDGTARAGDLLVIEGSLERSVGNLCIFSSTASVEGKTVASGSIMLHFHEPA